MNPKCRCKLTVIALSQIGVRAESAEWREYCKVAQLPVVPTINWCGGFMFWLFQKAEISIPLVFPMWIVARKWLKVGVSVKKPQTGDIVIYWRHSKKDWRGHVGVFLAFSADRKKIYTLGGNQGGMVSVRAYSASRVLGFRRVK
ncbi:MAG: TIGR02594 family protein [bacterium]|nr:TIGR02594 family protein [bacterium]